MNLIHNARPIKFANFPKYTPITAQVARRLEQGIKTRACITLLKVSRGQFPHGWNTIQIYARVSSICNGCFTQGILYEWYPLVPFKILFGSTSQGLKVDRKIWSNYPLQEDGWEVESRNHIDFIWKSSYWRPIKCIIIKIEKKTEKDGWQLINVDHQEWERRITIQKTQPFQQ